MIALMSCSQPAISAWREFASKRVASQRASTAAARQ
jgi:hypothetical protein